MSTHQQRRIRCHPGPRGSSLARLSAFAFQFKSLFRVFSVFRGQKSCATRPNQNWREPGTNRTALPIRQLTAAQKRTEPGSKANRTRIKSRLFPASASIHALDLHPILKNARTNRTTGNISRTTHCNHVSPFRLKNSAPIPSRFITTSPIARPHSKSAIRNPKSKILPGRSLLLCRWRLAFNPAHVALAPRHGPAARTR
jgi:hypothetical protein